MSYVMAAPEMMTAAAASDLASMTDHHAHQPSDDERRALFFLHVTRDFVLAELVTLRHEVCERVSRIEALEHRLDELQLYESQVIARILCKHTVRAEIGEESLAHWGAAS
jgi:hypothetical protein